MVYIDWKSQWVKDVVLLYDHEYALSLFIIIDYCTGCEVRIKDKLKKHI